MSIKLDIRLLFLAFISFVALELIDMYFVYFMGPEFQHYVKWIELLIFIIAFMGFGLIVRAIARLQSVESEMTLLREERDNLLQNKFSSGTEFAELINANFDKWSFTETEKIIALNLLRGKGIKEISEFRNVSESTIRNQCHFIYSKSGLAGKHELAAFFLKELFSY